MRVVIRLSMRFQTRWGSHELKRIIDPAIDRASLVKENTALIELESDLGNSAMALSVSKLELGLPEFRGTGECLTRG
jgi:hypothetical protein